MTGISDSIIMATTLAVSLIIYLFRNPLIQRYEAIQLYRDAPRYLGFHLGQATPAPRFALHTGAMRNDECWI